MWLLRWFLIGAGILAGVPVLLVLALAGKYWIDNWAYADRVFSGVVSYDRVVASRRWFLGGYGCIYAIVRLSPDASPEPPDVTLGPKAKPYGQMYSFGREWRPTPARLPERPQPDKDWFQCKDSLGDELYARLVEAAARPGGWWFGYMRPNHEMHVYAPAAGLAFRLREGD